MVDDGTLDGERGTTDEPEACASGLDTHASIFHGRHRIDDAVVTGALRSDGERSST